MANLPKLTDRILARLDDMTSQDGSVRAAFDKPGDALTTAQMVVLSSSVGLVKELLGKRVDRARDFLLDHQESDGHWRRSGDDWHTSITGWCLLALSHGSKVDRLRIKKAASWLIERQTPLGGFSQSATFDEEHTYSTSYACAGLHHTHDFEQAVSKGVSWLCDRQSLAGGFVDSCAVQRGPEASLTSYVAHALGPLNRSDSQTLLDGCRRFVCASQRPSGAWSVWYDDADSIEGTAACLRILQERPGAFEPQIKLGIQFLLRALADDDYEWWVAISLGHILHLFGSESLGTPKWRNLD